MEPQTGKKRAFVLALLLLLVGFPIRFRGLRAVERDVYFADVFGYRNAADTIQPRAFFKSGNVTALYHHWRPPGFPILLRIAWTLSGLDLRVSLWLTFLLGLLTAPVAFGVGRRIVGEGPAFLASWWIAVNPGLGYLAGCGLATELFMIEWLAFLYCIRPGRPLNWRSAAGAALAGTAATLTRPEAALMILGTIILIKPWRRHIPVAVASVAAAALFVILTHNQVSLIHGRNMYSAEFLHSFDAEKAQAPEMSFSEYLFRHHSIPKLFVMQLRGLGVFLESLDFVCGIPGAACLAVVGMTFLRERRWILATALAPLALPVFHLAVIPDGYRFLLPLVPPLLWMAGAPLASLLRSSRWCDRLIVALFLVIPCVTGWLWVPDWGRASEAFWLRLHG